MRAPYKPRPAGSAHAVVTELIGHMGGVDAVAAQLGKRPHVVQSWTDPDKSPGGVPLFFAARMTEISQSSLLPEHLAAHAGGWFIASAPVEGDLRDLAGEFARMGGTVVDRLVRLETRPTPLAARDLLIAVHEIQRILMAVRAQVASAARSESG